ncbi:MAG: ECF-type sigma factor [Candidatus Palauibacterales bacterium]|nr:ECF-type sigma factor [Candidatus Palauibacterales bacterium]MDP2528537.1 ECF-type sigma factor [Candidatus Palauibacterales bacterium]MDP2584767.1 ECF-type sigma factor [Candidatus Palauibacterales bacterium]
MLRTTESGPTSSPRGEITELLEAWGGGERDALDRLMALVYDDLRAIAHRRLRLERSDHTLDTTAIVHEAYLKLVDHEAATWKDRAHFFAVSARVIRNLLVDYARERKAAKRGGGAVLLPLDARLAGERPRTIELLALHEALTSLGRRDARMERVVECRFFGGMSMRETAETLGVSLSTAERAWRRARAHLYRALA